MNQATHILSLPVSGDAAMSYLMDALREEGLQTVQSFDLRLARSVHTDCKCPHHGSVKCNCQMVVLLVYENSSSPPATLAMHGQDGFTEVSLVNSPGQRPPEALGKRISNTFKRVSYVLLHPEVWPDVA